MLKATFSQRWARLDAAVSGVSLRRGRQMARNVVVACMLQAGVDVPKALMKRLADQPWPRGFSLEYGGDETTQWSSDAGKRTLMHVAVHTCRLWARLEDKPLLQEVLVPPTRLLDGRALTVAASTCNSLQLCVMGKDMLLSEWVKAVLEDVDFFVFLHFGDSASVNRVVARFLAKQVCVQHTAMGRDSVGVQRPMVRQGLFMFQPCLIHQLMRCLAGVGLHTSLSGSFFSITHLLQMSSYKISLKSALAALLQERLKRHVGKPPDPAPWRKLLVELLCPLRCGSGDLQMALQRLLAFFNGDLLAGEPEHFCSGPGCCSGILDCRRKAEELIVNAYLGRAVPLWNASRWTKMMPSMRWVGGLLLVHKMLPLLLNTIQNGARATKMGNNNDDDDLEGPMNMALHNSKRLARSTAVFSDACACARVAIEMFCLRNVEVCMFKLFACTEPLEAVGATNAAVGATNAAVGATNAAVGATNAERTFRAFNTLSRSLATSCASSAPESPLADLVRRVWPSDQPIGRAYDLIRNSVVTLAAEVYIRMEPMFSAFPLNVLVGKGSAADLSRTPPCCCDGGLAGPLQAQCRNLGGRAAGTLVNTVLRQISQAWRPSTVTEERAHAQQRLHTLAPTPTQHAMQSTKLLVQGMQRLWAEQKGRRLDMAPQEVQIAADRLAGKKRRPGKIIRRGVAQAARGLRHDGVSFLHDTPYGIGDSMWPVAEGNLRNFVDAEATRLRDKGLNLDEPAWLSTQSTHRRIADGLRRTLNKVQEPLPAGLVEGMPDLDSCHTRHLGFCPQRHRGQPVLEWVERLRALRTSEPSFCWLQVQPAPAGAGDLSGALCFLLCPVTRVHGASELFLLCTAHPGGPQGRIEDLSQHLGVRQGVRLQADALQRDVISLAVDADGRLAFRMPHQLAVQLTTLLPRRFSRRAVTAWKFFKIPEWSSIATGDVAVGKLVPVLEQRNPQRAQDDDSDSSLEWVESLWKRGLPDAGVASAPEMKRPRHSRPPDVLVEVQPPSLGADVQVQPAGPAVQVQPAMRNPRTDFDLLHHVLREQHIVLPDGFKIYQGKQTWSAKFRGRHVPGSNCPLSVWGSDDAAIVGVAHAIEAHCAASLR